MSKRIEDTKRCRLFEEIAETVWNKIIRAHDVKMDLKEIGITADIIVDILHYNKKGIPNFDVYARPGWDENTYGSDIDIFIETDPGDYCWFALQAKILKKNKRYTTLRDSSDSIMQWEKLMLLEGLTGCKGYYLLYNGKGGFTISQNNLCNRNFSEKHYGCSLVEPSIIMNLAARRNIRNTAFKNPTFEEIHPTYAQPWRVLVCCYHDKEKFTLYEIGEINEANYNYQLIEDIEAQPDYNEPGDNSQIQRPLDNRIMNLSNEARWNPGLRIVIGRTDNL